MTQALAINTLEQFADIELDQSIQNGSKYTNTQRLHAVLVFMSLGSIPKTAEVVNVPFNTLYYWRKTEWWDKLTTKLRDEKRNEFDAGFTRIIDKAINNIENQLDSGNVSARDAATIMGITFDKRQVLNNQPTSISKSLNVKDMFDQFQRFIDAKTIDSELVDD